MGSILEKIEQALKDMLIGWIESNLTNMFTDVNEKVGTIAAEVGQTPSGWNGGVYQLSLIHIYTAMQDEVNTKVVAIMIKGGKISAEVLKKALDKFVQEIEKAQKQMQQPKTYRGKQSIKHLMSQNAAISNIEVTDGNIKSFERTASKYGLDFALKKDVSVEPPSYLVFFKGRDVDVMTAAFKEFSAKTVKQKEQPSIRHKLDHEKAQSKAQHKEKVKVKTKDRGVEL